MESRAVHTKMEEFDESVMGILGQPFSADELIKLSTVSPTYECYEDEDRVEPIMEADEVHPDTYDGYIEAQVLLPKGEEYHYTRAMSRKHGPDGEAIGKGNPNPVLDTRVCKVEFLDSEVLEYSTNVIADYLYSQLDEEGFQQVMMDCIVDHQSDAMAVLKDDAFIQKGSNHTRRKTMKGWKLCVQWQDSSMSWETLKDLKHTYPIKVAEYAVANKISEEPAFVWWVPYTLRCQDSIIAKLNKRYHKRSHKFGIELPKSVPEALAINKWMGTTLWANALAKEMRTVKVTFQFLENGEEVPVGYQEIKGHMVFDIKMGTLQRKCRYVAGSHMTDPPATITYASVVSRESVRITLTLAALNDMKVLTTDILGTYLTAPCDEKIWLT